MDNNQVYVRIDKKINDVSPSQSDFKDHIEYLSKISEDRYFLGGGFTDIPGGMIIFKANSLEEAEQICEQDPIISRKFFNYDLLSWDIILKSDKTI